MIQILHFESKYDTRPNNEDPHQAYEHNTSFASKNSAVTQKDLDIP